MSEFAAGVDAGGTKTVVACATNRDDEPAYARGAGANPTLLGVDAAADAIAQTIRAALPAGATLASLYAGIAGAGRTIVAVQLTDALSSRFPSVRRLTVGDDLEIGFRAALPAGPGVAILAGTGSVAYGENGNVRVRAGGAGYLLGDEGSAFAIGFAAVRLLALAYDGRARNDETTRFVERVLGVATRDSLIDCIYGVPKIDVPRIASMAPSIVAFAGKGNQASRKIVEQAAQDLADLGESVIEQCELHEHPRIVLGGGLFRDSSLLRDLVVDYLTASSPLAEFVFAPADETAAAAVALRHAFLPAAKQP